MIFKLS